MKKFLSLVLVFVLCVNVISGITVPASAVESGTCGENVTWTLDGYGTLTISGNGKIADYTAQKSAPWKSAGESVKQLVVKNGITAIGSRAFYGCYELTTITLPSSLVAIGDEAFYHCSAITNVGIPSEVKTIGEAAFRGCSSLTKITIPASVETLGDWAFCACEKLASITVDENNPNYSSLSENLYNKDQTQLIQYAIGKTTTFFSVPVSVETIEQGAFSSCDSLSSVRISNQVVIIEENAFSYCGALSSIKIPDSVKTIGDSAFAGCSALKSVDISSSVESIGQETFLNCDALSTILIPASVVSIGTNAFSDCDSLKTITVDEDNPIYSANSGDLYNKDQTLLIQYAIGKTTSSFTIPNSVETIGDYAFRNSNLTSVSIPSSVKTIGAYSFKWCALKSITIPNSVVSIGEHAFENSSLESVSLSSSLESIGKDAFAWTDLTSIWIPSSVKEIGESAFDVCNELTSINVDENNMYYSSLWGNLYNKDQTVLVRYSEGKTATSFDVPNTVVRIGNGAFECSDLEKITIPNSVTAIGDNAFSVCVRLKSISLPKAITTIGEGAFSGCRGLSSIRIPDSVAEIKKYTFSGCEGITSVSIPESVKKIDGYAFSNCRLLSSVSYGGDQSDREKILIESGNECLTNSSWHYTTMYRISVSATNGGNVITDKIKTSLGKTVTLSAMPNEGYRIKNFIVDGVAIDGNIFTMPAKDVTVSAEFELIPYTVPLSTINGAQIRTSGNQGVRFISSIEKSEDFDHVVEYGTILIPSDDITDVSELVIDATLNGHKVAKVPANYIYNETDDAVTFTAVITNIAVKNYKRAYTARAYAIFDNGTVIYSDTGASRSIYQVAERGLLDPYASAENKAVFQAIVDAVSNDDIWGGIY